ncbi:MAG: hypothetical protein VX112_04635 [Pseudomonadota bacterium]|nr:hypothetical protein [Pseudomonadota bacterium]
MTLNSHNRPILAVGSYLENLYYTALIFNIINVILSICVLPIHVSPIILVCTIAVTPLFVLLIRTLEVKNHKPKHPKNWLQKLGDKIVNWYCKHIANHWVSKLIWDIILAFGVTSSLYSLFTYFDISLGLHHVSLISQLSIIGGALFLTTQISNYFLKDIEDPQTQQVSRFIEIANKALLFALTSIVTIGSLYAEVYIFGINFVLLSILVTAIAAISIFYTLAQSELEQAQQYTQSNIEESDDCLATSLDPDHKDEKELAQVDNPMDDSQLIEKFSEITETFIGSLNQILNRKKLQINTNNDVNYESSDGLQNMIPAVNNAPSDVIQNADSSSALTNKK